MRTRADIKKRLKYDLKASDASSLYDDASLNEVIEDAHIWATDLYSWPALKQSKETTAPAVFNGDQYITYPEEYKDDTMDEFIYVGGEKYERKSWNTYQDHIRENPTDTSEKIFADYARKTFIFPQVAIGTAIILWGQIAADPLTTDLSETIFSHHDESGNEAIELKAYSSLIRSTDPAKAKEVEDEAVRILTAMWIKIKNRQANAQNLNKPMFNVPDFFAGRGVSFKPKNF